MPNKTDKSDHGNSEAFAKFVAESPELQKAAGTPPLVVTGVVNKSETEGMFILTTGNGAVELPLDAVRSHKVVEEGTTARVVELTIDTSKIPAGSAAPERLQWPKPVHKDPIFDTLAWSDRPHTLKEVIKDPITDPITWVEGIFGPNSIAEGVLPDPSGGMQPFGTGASPQAMPFVLATPHHAPMAALNLQGGPALPITIPAVDTLHTLKEGPKDPVFDTLAHTDRPHTLKEGIKDPLFDTYAWTDTHHTLKEMIKDPIADPNTWVEGPGTIVEGGGMGSPGVWNLPGMMF